MRVRGSNLGISMIYKKNVLPIKAPFCKSIFYLHNWCKKIGFDYHYINIYNRKTGNYISRQYCNVYITDKPLY
jgi:hypothetical protein